MARSDASLVQLLPDDERVRSLNILKHLEKELQLKILRHYNQDTESRTTTEESVQSWHKRLDEVHTATSLLSREKVYVRLLSTGPANAPNFERCRRQARGGDAGTCGWVVSAGTISIEVTGKNFGSTRLMLLNNKVVHRSRRPRVNPNANRSSHQSTPLIDQHPHHDTPQGPHDSTSCIPTPPPVALFIPAGPPPPVQINTGPPRPGQGPPLALRAPDSGEHSQELLGRSPPPEAWPEREGGQRARYDMEMSHDVAPGSGAGGDGALRAGGEGGGSRMGARPPALDRRPEALQRRVRELRERLRVADECLEMIAHRHGPIPVPPSSPTSPLSPHGTGFRSSTPGSTHPRSAGPPSPLDHADHGDRRHSTPGNLETPRPRPSLHIVPDGPASYAWPHTPPATHARPAARANPEARHSSVASSAARPALRPQGSRPRDGRDRTQHLYHVFDPAGATRRQAGRYQPGRLLDYGTTEDPQPEEGPTHQAVSDNDWAAIAEAAAEAIMLNAEQDLSSYSHSHSRPHTQPRHSDPSPSAVLQHPTAQRSRYPACSSLSPSPPARVSHGARSHLSPGPSPTSSSDELGQSPSRVAAPFRSPRTILPSEDPDSDEEHPRYRQEQKEATGAGPEEGGAGAQEGSLGGGRHALEQTLCSFVCPITKSLLTDPVIAADGFTYERSAIQQWFECGRCSSPITNLPLPHTHLLPNLGMRGAIQEWQHARGY